MLTLVPLPLLLLPPGAYDKRICTVFIYWQATTCSKAKASIEHQISVARRQYLAPTVGSIESVSNSDLSLLLCKNVVNFQSTFTPKGQGIQFEFISLVRYRHTSPIQSGIINAKPRMSGLVGHQTAARKIEHNPVSGDHTTPSGLALTQPLRKNAARHPTDSAQTWQTEKLYATRHRDHQKQICKRSRDQFVCDFHLNDVALHRHGKYVSERDTGATARAHRYQRAIRQR